MAEYITLEQLNGSPQSGGYLSLSDVQKQARAEIANEIDNDAISKGARSFAGEGWGSKYLSALGGAVRGAAGIGTTLLTPIDAAVDAIKGDRGPTLSGLITGQQPMSRSEERRAALDPTLQYLGADPSSLFYKGGKLSTEVLGTLGVGGALAAPIRAIGGAAPLAKAAATALETGGFRAPGLTGVSQLGARMGAGALTGGVSAGLVDPSEARAGALLGGLLPPAAQVAGQIGTAVGGALRSGAERMMQSAIKPTLPQLKSGDAAVATQVMLDQGINPTKAGVEKLRGLIDTTDDAISSAIQNSTAQVDKNAVLNRLGGTRSTFTMQAAPQNDLAAIQGIEDAFRAHPQFSGPTIPVQDAQALKRGTYKVLQGKYGEQGAAAVEAQKDLARGLKEEVAAAVPDVVPLNAKLSDLIKAHDVVERRALMEANKNPFGLSPLAPTPQGVLEFMADRSAILKALAARGMNAAANPAQRGLLALDNPALLPYARAGLLATSANP